MSFLPLKSFFPTSDELLHQDLPTLGKVLLTHLKSYKGLNTVYQHAGLNRGYFRAMLENRSIGLGTLPREPEYQSRQPEVTKRMMEAWSWLERQGLLIHNDEQVADWFIISSDGEKYLDQDKLPTSPLSNLARTSKLSLGAPRAFLSYSWDGPAHHQWVRNFAERIQGESGVEVTFDQWHLQPGTDKLHFMERGVSEADFVIVVCTPKYAERANQRSGGVGYESMVITAELAEHIATNKFIPVLRTGTWTSAIPNYLKSRFGVDLNGEPYDEQEYVKLLRALHREPIEPPPIGKKPDFSQETKSKTEHNSAKITNAQPPLSAHSDLARIFIRTRPGERSGDVRTVKASAVIENVSAKRKIADYVCTMSIPRACLTHMSAVILGEVRQEAPSNRRVFRVSSSDPGRPAIIFQGDKVPLFALDLGVDQLKLTGTYLAGDYEGTLVERVIVDAVVEGELIHDERTVADIFENPQQG
jgi:TIR domain